MHPTHPWVAAGRDKIRFAIVGGAFPDWPRTVEFVQQAEELGFDAYWANDHPTRGLDCFTMLTALAAATKTIRLVSLVSCIYYHSPAMIARMAADVDRTLHEIVESAGGRTPEQAKEYVENLRQTKRYKRDVY